MSRTPETAPKRRKWIRKSLWLLALSVLLGLGLSLYLGGRFVAPIQSYVGPLPAEFQGEQLSFPSESGSQISGWHIQAQNSRGVVVLLHSLGGNRTMMLGRARFLSKAGYSSVLIDFQGHGESPGEHVTFGHLEKHDVVAAVAVAKKLHPDEPIAVLGWSLGGAAAVLASPLSIDALIIEAVYSDIQEGIHNRVAMHLGPFASIPTELLLLQIKPRLGISPKELRPIAAIEKVSAPIFVIGGADDKRTPRTETEALFLRAPSPKKLWIVPKADHVDLMKVDPKVYEGHILRFLEEHLH